MLTAKIQNGVFIVKAMFGNRGYEFQGTKERVNKLLSRYVVPQAKEKAAH
jgi:hypothetical protein